MKMCTLTFDANRNNFQYETYDGSASSTKTSMDRDTPKRCGATTGATGAAHFHTIGDQPRECLTGVAKRYRANQLIAVQPQISQGHQGAEGRRNGSRQLIDAQVQARQGRQSVERQRNGSGQLIAAHRQIGQANQKSQIVGDLALNIITIRIQDCHSGTAITFHAVPFALVKIGRPGLRVAARTKAGRGWRRL
jgi:hypothetical protein